MTAAGKTSHDTDWFLDRLYSFPELDQASLLIATHSRYVIDLNRSIKDESLYPGQTTTGLVPRTRFDGKPIYLDSPPDADEIQSRIQTYWQPYHQKLQLELNRLVAMHGHAVLLDAHSIASRVPRLFEGTIPDFNIGTNRGSSCSGELEQAIVDVLQLQSKYSHVTNGRFIGGYITRNYGHPKENVHAVQFELSQATYMDETSLDWNSDRAHAVQPVFQQLILAILKWIQTN